MHVGTANGRVDERDGPFPSPADRPEHAFSLTRIIAAGKTKRAVRGSSSVRATGRGWVTAVG